MKKDNAKKTNLRTVINTQQVSEARRKHFKFMDGEEITLTRKERKSILQLVTLFGICCLVIGVVIGISI
jgi:hypothetical protein